MNVFVPYSSILDCAKTIYEDRRFQKQILEIDQIVRAIEGAIPWSKHPCVLMYKDHKEWLKLYRECFIAYREYMKGNEKTFFRLCCFYDLKASKLTPPFLTEDFCNQHNAGFIPSRPNYTLNSQNTAKAKRIGTSLTESYSSISTANK